MEVAAARWAKQSKRILKAARDEKAKVIYVMAYDGEPGYTYPKKIINVKTGKPTRRVTLKKWLRMTPNQQDKMMSGVKMLGSNKRSRRTKRR